MFSLFTLFLALFLCSLVADAQCGCGCGCGGGNCYGGGVVLYNAGKFLNNFYVQCIKIQCIIIDTLYFKSLKSKQTKFN